MLAIKWMKILARIILYVLLFAFFCYFYMIDQMADYIKGRTTVTSRFEEVEYLEPPTITVCMHPLFKPTIMASYGLTDQNQFPSGAFDGKPLEELWYLFSYVLGRDFTIEMEIDGEVKNVSKGLVTYGNLSYEVKPFQTIDHGTCYKIQPSFMIFSLPFDCSLRISLSSNLSQADMPSKAIIYLTSNNTWQGIVTSDWPQFPPSKLELDMGKTYKGQLKPTEYRFEQGVENSEECWKKYFMRLNCTFKCTFVSVTDLPMCKTSQDVRCIIENLDNLGGTKPWNVCNRRKKALTYHGQLIEKAKYSSSNATFTDLDILSFTKEVKEEIDVITLSDLIGSLGGSLGMFFGFSISSYTLYLIDFIIKVTTHQALFTSR